MSRERLVIGLLVLLGVAARPGWSQPGGAGVPRMGIPCLLQLEIAQDGSADVFLTVPAPEAPIEEIQEALNEVLGGRFILSQGSATALGVRLQGRCEQAAQFSEWDFTLKGDLDPTPLIDCLGKYRIRYLDLTLLHRPDAVNALLSEGLAPSTYRLPFQRLAGSWQQLTYVTNQPVLEPLRWEFGYRLERLGRLIPLVLLLGAGLGLTYWARNSALRQGVKDPYAAWHRHFHYQKRLSIWFFGAWCCALTALDISSFVFFVAPRYLPAVLAPVAALAFLVFPIGIALYACRRLAEPVHALLPELDWSPFEVRRRARLGLLALLVPSTCLGLALGGLATDNALVSRLFAALTLITALVLGWKWQGMTQRKAPLLPVGQVRTRIEEMADDRALARPSIYLLPAPQWRLLQVFAMPGRSLHLTPSLFEELTTRELDALVAHEMVLLGPRPWLAWIPVLLPWAALVGLSIFWLRLGIELWYPVFLWLTALSALAPSQTRARFSAKNDCHALAFSADPEALITALVKMSRKKLLPYDLQLSLNQEGLPMRRLENLADRIGIPPERLQEICARGTSGGDHYVLEPSPGMPEVSPVGAS